MPRRLVVLGLLLSALLAPSAHAADSLEDLLRGIEKAATLSAPLRGTGTIDVDGISGKSRDHVTILTRPAKTPGGTPQVFLDLSSAKLRALALAPAELHVAAGGSPRSAAPDTPLPPTSFSAEDLLGFSRARCAAMRIADLSNDQFTLVCEPVRKVSQYVLAVYKFERARHLPLQVLLYKDGMTNLVKMLRQDDFVAVGGGFAPTRVVMQDFKLRTRDELALAWQPAPDAPDGAFDATSFASVTLPAAAK